MSNNRYAILQAPVTHQPREKHTPKKKNTQVQSQPNQPTPAQRAKKNEQAKKQQQVEQQTKSKTMPKPRNQEEKEFITVQHSRKNKQKEDEGVRKLNKEEFVQERKKGNTKKLYDTGANDDKEGGQQQRRRRDDDRQGQRKRREDDQGQGQGGQNRGQGGQNRGQGGQNRGQGGQNQGQGGQVSRQGQGQGEYKPKYRHNKKYNRGPDSLNNPDNKRQGRTHGGGQGHYKRQRDNLNSWDVDLEKKPEEKENETEQQDNEGEKVKVDDSESSEYYCEGILVENKAENKLVDTPLSEGDVKRKGLKSYLEGLETQKSELNQLLEKNGLTGKKDEGKEVKEVEVENLSKKDKPLEIEDKRDSFFIKSPGQEVKQKKPKEKKTDKTGFQTVPVSKVLKVHTKRHRGFNTVPEDKRPQQKKDETKKDETKKEETKKDETKKEETKKEETKKEETKKDETKKEETKKDESKTDVWGDNKSQQNWSGSPQNPRQNPRKNQNQGPRRSRFVDFESTQQFPPLSGDIEVEKKAPEKWRPE